MINFNRLYIKNPITNLHKLDDRNHKIFPLNESPTSSISKTPSFQLYVLCGKNKELRLEKTSDIPINLRGLNKRASSTMARNLLWNAQLSKFVWSNGKVES